MKNIFILFQFLEIFLFILSVVHIQAKNWDVTSKKQGKLGAGETDFQHYWLQNKVKDNQAWLIFSSAQKMHAANLHKWCKKSYLSQLSNILK